MNAVAVDRYERTERVATAIAVALQRQYPFVTTEIVLDPPDGESDAWVVVLDVEDADYRDEITNTTLDLTVAGQERDGVLVLAI